MEPAGDDAVTRAIRASVLVLVGLVVVLVPLPFGGVSERAVLALEIAAVLIGLATAWLIWREGLHLTSRARLALAPVVVLLIVGIVQLLPLPVSWEEAAWLPLGTLRQAVVAGVPDLDPPVPRLSISPADTLDALFRFTAVVLVGFATTVAVATPKQARLLALLALASGAFQALYGSIEHVTGHQHIFGYQREHYLGSATGTFVNRNHFAGYLAMTLPFAGALLAARQPGSRSNGWRSRVLGLAQPRGLLHLSLIGAALCIWGGILLSSSRGGLLAALLGIAYIGFKLRRRNLRVSLLVLLLLVPVVFLMAQALDAPGVRLTALGGELDPAVGRLGVWKAALPLVWEQPLSGYGFGTFDAVFSLIQPASIAHRYRHAHNDWLQTAIEGGLVAFTASVALLWVLLKRGGRYPFPTSLPAVLGFASGASLVVVAGHAVVDFGLRIPAIAVLAAVVGGLRCSPALIASR